MTDVRVGDVRKVAGLGYVYVIVDIPCFRAYTVIEQSGYVLKYKPKHQIEIDELLAHYDTWQEAVNSKEFNG